MTNRNLEFFFNNHLIKRSNSIIMLDFIILTTFLICAIIATIMEMVTHWTWAASPSSPPSSDIEVICRWSVNGCSNQEDEHTIAIHEERCPHREVFCPAKFRGKCQWTGSIKDLVAHFKEKACIQIVRANCNQSFKSYITDFPHPGQTVFNMTKTMYWKPIILVSRGVVNYLVYITVQRTPTGIWYIIPRSFASPANLRRLTIKLQLFKYPEAHARGASTSQQLEYIYIGRVTSSNLSNEEVLVSSDYLRLTDRQLSLLKTTETIFNYKAAIYLVPKRRIP